MWPQNIVPLYLKKQNYFTKLNKYINFYHFFFSGDRLSVRAHSMGRCLRGGVFCLRQGQFCRSQRSSSTTCQVEIAELLHSTFIGKQERSRSFQVNNSNRNSQCNRNIRMMVRRFWKRLRFWFFSFCLGLV